MGVKKYGLALFLGVIVLETFGMQRVIKGFTKSAPHLLLSQSKAPCQSCKGMSVVPAKISRKEYMKRKRKREGGGDISSNVDLNAPMEARRMVKCSNCGGVGLIDAPSPRLLTAAQQHRHRPEKTSIIIVGAGIAGASLALALQQRSVPCRIFEKDGDFDTRKQGYGLTMQQGGRGLEGLGFVMDGNEDEEREDFGIHSKRHLVFDATGKKIGQWGHDVWKSKDKSGKHNSHIARQTLRKRLVDQLLPGSIVYGSSFEGMRSAEGGGIVAEFGNGTSVTGDCLVGADGIFSRVRREIGLEGSDGAGDELRFLGVFVMLGIFEVGEMGNAVHDSEGKTGGKGSFENREDPSDEGADAEDAEAERGDDSTLFDFKTVFQASDGATRIYSMPFNSTHYMWQLSFPVEELVGKDLSATGGRGMKKEAEKRLSGEGWTFKRVQEMIEKTEESDVTGYNVFDRDNFDLSQGKNKHLPVSLIGDAAHPMSPFKGQGANQAILDGLLFGRMWHQIEDGVNGGNNKDDDNDDDDNDDDGDDDDDDDDNDDDDDDNNNKIKSEEAVKTMLRRFEAEMMYRAVPKVRGSEEAARALHSGSVLKEGNFTRGKF